MKRAMWIVWPSFLVAGLLEGLVFAAVDPSEILHLLEEGWSRMGLYSVTFLVLWAVVAAASSLSLWLAGALDQSDVEQGAGAAVRGGKAHPA